MRTDNRGFFARTWCQEEFAALGLNLNIAQCSISHNERKGSLRGMHFQVEPHREAKLVRCTSGAIYDVLLDLRRDSPAYGQWFATELSAFNRAMLYIPEGVAHGFQTLEDDTEVFYQISEVHHAESARGVRWDDPAFRIEWPQPDPIMSDKDKSYDRHCG